MCGIVAFFKPDGHADGGAAVRRATRLMAHRGPDGEGFHVDGPIALGHRRLSIIDLGGGAQPIFNEDNSIAVVYNGEIYNFKDVQAELESKGHRFRSASDTEVIVHAYEEWGERCLERFNGMFAFALWDARRKKLWAVRDRMGVKPLYYWTDGKQLALASEIKPLLALGAPGGLNERVLDACFTLGYVPGPETMFKGILKLPPGHHLSFSADGMAVSEYWDFAGVETSALSEKESIDRILPLLRDAVSKCLVSDVPLGVFLSGGLDSSAVVALMQECGVNPVNSFTVGYDGPQGEGELSFARAVARRFETRHHVFTLEPLDFFESLRTLLRHAEEPLVEPAGVALFHLSRLARNEVTVLLSGEGSDEVFGGYALYQTMMRLSAIQSFVPPQIWRSLLPARGVLPREKYRKYLDWLSQPLAQRYQGTSAYLTPSLKQRYYSADFLDARGGYLEDTFARLFDRVAAQSDPLRKMLYIDARTWLVDDLLLKADKMTMAASVELRVPFLDHRLVEAATALPSGLKIHRHEGKWILKKSMEDRLSPEIIWRSKMGFPVPVKRWLGGELIAQTRSRLLDGGVLEWFRRREVERLIDQHEAGTEDHSRFLMSLLVMSIWREEYGG